jgi:hypothetical protein
MVSIFTESNSIITGSFSIIISLFTCAKAVTEEIKNRIKNFDFNIAEKFRVKIYIIPNKCNAKFIF